MHASEACQQKTQEDLRAFKLAGSLNHGKIAPATGGVYAGEHFSSVIAMLSYSIIKFWGDELALIEHGFSTCFLGVNLSGSIEGLSTCQMYHKVAVIDFDGILFTDSFQIANSV